MADKMADWGMLAVVVAIIAILFGPIRDMVREYVVKILYQRSKCDAIRWRDLSGQPIPSRAVRPVGSGDSSNIRILRLFEHVWGATARLVGRPRYLKRDVQYLRVDTDVLTVSLMLEPGGEVFFPIAANGASSSPSRGWGSFAIHEGRVLGDFRRYKASDDNDAYIVGTLRGFPPLGNIKPRLYGLTKTELLAIAHGYPPFYRETFKANSGMMVPHPIREPRDVCRAGWVVAIGFASHKPVRLYNKGNESQYEQACGRVLHTLKGVLTTEFGKHPTIGPILELTVMGVEVMNRVKTGSAVSRASVYLERIEDANPGPIGKDLDVAQISLILNLFNDYGKDALDDDERRELESLLPEALRAALVGVLNWWVYVNNEGRAIPEWLLDERIRLCPIWLRDCGVGEDASL
ncbi:hypothetical protein TWF696_006054 [Orbilia brochopaga]|uniref:Uncharacterized protein n=1 Tax=Orbilia brochopaga TaxID=3140254 RepID=A0AAV9UVX5_9PEZI